MTSIIINLAKTLWDVGVVKNAKIVHFVLDWIINNIIF